VWCIAASIENTPMRLPMKFGVSFAYTTPLPRVVTRKVSRPARIAGSVVVAGISSARCM
jgi:xanthine/uracil permease